MTDIDDEHESNVKCAANTRSSNEAGHAVSWCGERLWSHEWYFCDASHALINGLRGSRLLLCANCASVMRGALHAAETGEEYENDDS